MALVIQNTTNKKRGTGMGLGYAQINPAYVIEFDTCQNSELGDPAKDHVGIRGNGIAKHDQGDFEEVENLEDGKWHPMVFKWNAAARTFDLSLDSKPVFTGRSFAPADLTKGYFGFTATTGLFSNKQSVRNMILEDES